MGLAQELAHTSDPRVAALNPNSVLPQHQCDDDQGEYAQGRLKLLRGVELLQEPDSEWTPRTRWILQNRTCQVRVVDEKKA